MNESAQIAELVRVVDDAINAWWGSLDPRPTLPEAIVAALFKPCGCMVGTTDRDCPDCNDGEVRR